VERFDTIARTRLGDEVEVSTRFVRALNDIRRSQRCRGLTASDAEAGKSWESPLQRSKRF
jgi:hypothetical protein